MERLLTRSRVLLAFCCTLLLAALNRRDPMVYGMFLFLATVTVMGFVLPWLSLRGMAVRLRADCLGGEVIEGAGCDIGIVVERSVRWPAFMVDVETEWEWAGRHLTLRQTIPVVRAGKAVELGRQVRFACRGHYRLVAVRLASGFPLGLVQARHAMQHTGIAVHVLPKPQAMYWPLPWNVSPDPSGTLATRHTGQSFELGLLREYQQGDSVGRVNWRASARVGELVIQHFQQLGAVVLRVAVHAPAAPALGNPASAGEQAIRLAAGVFDAAQGHGAQAFLYLAGDGEPVQGAALVRTALAAAQPASPAQLCEACMRVAAVARVGDQIALVVPGDMVQADLAAALAELKGVACAVVVCIALGHVVGPAQLVAAQGLQAVAQRAGAVSWMEAP